jgi:antitoxin component YwqK of YwqJK toxin-antitoxin module
MLFLFCLTTIRLKGNEIIDFPKGINITALQKQTKDILSEEGLVPFFRRASDVYQKITAFNNAEMTSFPALYAIPDHYWDFAMSEIHKKKVSGVSLVSIECIYTYFFITEFEKDQKQQTENIPYLSNVKITKSTHSIVNSNMTLCIISLHLKKDHSLWGYSESYSGGGSVPSYDCILFNDHLLNELTISRDQHKLSIIWDTKGQVKNNTYVRDFNPFPTSEELADAVKKERDFINKTPKHINKKMLFDWKKIKLIQYPHQNDTNIQTLLTSIQNRISCLIGNNSKSIVTHNLFDISGPIHLKLQWNTDTTLSLECLQEQNDGISKGYKMEFSKEGALMLYQEGNFKHFANRNFKRTLTEVSFYPSGYPKQYRTLYGDQIKGDIIQWNENGELESKKENSSQNP